MAFWQGYNFSHSVLYLFSVYRETQSLRLSIWHLSSALSLLQIVSVCMQKKNALKTFAGRNKTFKKSASTAYLSQSSLLLNPDMYTSIHSALPDSPDLLCAYIFSQVFSLNTVTMLSCSGVCHAEGLFLILYYLFIFLLYNCNIFENTLLTYKQV